MAKYEEFPRCLYQGADVSKIVRSEGELNAALQSGWSLTVADTGPAQVLADIAGFHTAHDAAWINEPPVAAVLEAIPDPPKRRKKAE